MGFGGAAVHLFAREGANVVQTEVRDELGEHAAAVLRADGRHLRGSRSTAGVHRELCVRRCETSGVYVS